MLIRKTTNAYRTLKAMPSLLGLNTKANAITDYIRRPLRGNANQDSEQEREKGERKIKGGETLRRDMSNRLQGLLFISSSSQGIGLARILLINREQ